MHIKSDGLHDDLSIAPARQFAYAEVLVQSTDNDMRERTAVRLLLHTGEVPCSEIIFTLSFERCVVGKNCIYSFIQPGV